MNLPVKRQKTNIALRKTKSIFDIAKKLLGSNSDLVDDSWMQRLWDWADENEIPELGTLDDDDSGEEYIGGIPRNKVELLSLSELSISDASFTYLPKEIGNLTTLKRLYLRNNYDLTHLPKEIGNLENLEILYLVGSKIDTFPKDIKKLINLTKLTLYSNNFSNFPIEIIYIPNLEIFNFSDRKLTKIGKEIGNLINLKELYIRGGKFKELPVEICKLEFLESLELLRCSNLSILPKEIGLLIDLRSLKFCVCDKLAELPNEIIKLTNLESLILPNGKNLKLTQRQKLWLINLEKNGCNIYESSLYKRKKYDSKYEGFNNNYNNLGSNYPWWSVFDIWETGNICQDISQIIYSPTIEQSINIKDNNLVYIDRVTGLMWEMKNSKNIQDNYLWIDIFKYAEKLNNYYYAGFDDWIIPNQHMLLNLPEKVYPEDIKTKYWCSKPYEFGSEFSLEARLDTAAYYEAGINHLAKIRSTTKLHVICVRVYAMDTFINFCNENIDTAGQKLDKIAGLTLDSNMFIFPECLNENKSLFDD